ncbi:MAG: sigma-70 family RNA polymerase sigma factor [Deltaproteobacteria bacterium]|nr:sigma-70 family RNA polymerase sigma factor [Deltaproteobacteria bacterium]
MLAKTGAKERERARSAVPEQGLSRSFSTSVADDKGEVSDSGPTDEQLMARYQKGEEAGFEEIYARYSKKIYQFLLRRSGNPDASAELFQETFLRVHKGRDLYRPELSFKTWIYTIANNIARDWFREQSQSRKARVLEKKQDCDENSFEGSVPDGSSKLISFKEAFARLTHEQREALILSRFDGLRYEEIAKVTGRSTDAVNQLIQRAMRRLRECVDEP